MHDVAAGFRATTPPVGLWIDFSQQTPDETVEEILTPASGSFAPTFPRCESIVARGCPAPSGEGFKALPPTGSRQADDVVEDEMAFGRTHRRPHKRDGTAAVLLEELRIGVGYR